MQTERNNRRFPMSQKMKDAAIGNRSLRPSSTPLEFAIPTSLGWDSARDTPSIKTPDPAVHLMSVEDYPSMGDEPDPLDASATKKEFLAHLQELQDYSDAMFKTYNRTKMYGRRLWLDLTKAFRPHTVKAMSRPMVTEWTDVLHQRGIYVDNRHGVSCHVAMIQVITRATFVPAETNDDDLHPAQQSAAVITVKDDGRQPNDALLSK